MKKIFYEESVELTVLFNEVDAMNVVWHGNYFRYFEAARSRLCAKHNIDIKDFIEAGIYAPVARSECKYKMPLFYNDSIIVKAVCYFQTDPKLVINYKIFNKNSSMCTTTGRTEQLYLDTDFNLLLEQPRLAKSFFEKMQNDTGLVE